MTIVLKPATAYGPIIRNHTHWDSQGYVIGSTPTSYVFPKSVPRFVNSDRRAWRQSLVNGYPRQTTYSATHYTNGSLGLGQINSTRDSDGRITVATSDFGLILLGWNALFEDVSVQNLANAAMNSSRSKLNGLVRNQYYSTFETLYEGKKTRDMVSKAATTILQSYQDVRRGNFLRAAKRLGLSVPPKGLKPPPKGRKPPRHGSKDSPGYMDEQRVSSNWLEYRYGWGPLYQTVYGEVKRKFDHMRDREPVVVQSSTSDTYHITKTDFTGYKVDDDFGFIGARYRGKRVISYSISCRSVAAYKVHNIGLANYTEIGLTNPALVAWELVPLSFVADWFVNVSDVLEQMDAWAGKTILSYSDTVRISAAIDNTAEFNSVSGNTINSIVYPSYKSHAVYVNRTLRATPPTIALGFQPQFTNKRVLDAVALLAQAFGK